MTILEITINKNIEVVWDYIKDISSHTQWMQDAKSIELLFGSANTIGANYLCITKVAGIKTDDIFKIIKYEKPNLIEISHTGVVNGSGFFRLVKIDETTTKFTWEENLRFPWYMGSIVGKKFGMLLLHKIWKKNLLRLKEQVENK
jgi:uncharacterized membrane protein